MTGTFLGTGHTIVDNKDNDPVQLELWFTGKYRELKGISIKL